MYNKEYSIGIFDSGLGGTTVLKEIVKLLPNENIIYFADRKNAPYGSKTADEVRSFSKIIVDFLIEKKCKIIVIACNTSSIASIKFLKETYKDISILGIINAGVSEAVKNTKNNNIAVFATEFTVNSNAYKNEINQNIKADVFEISCPEFVPLIEEGLHRKKITEDIIQDYTKKIPKNSDTLVLGCTHYPLIKDIIEKYYNGYIVDPANKLAIQTKDKLKELNLLNNVKKYGEIKFYINGNLDNFKSVAEQFLQFEINQIERIDI